MPDREIPDSQIHRLIDDWQDRHPEGPDEDSLRAYFADRLHQDWRAGWLAGYGGVAAAVVAGAVLALLVVWAVTS